MRYAQLAPADSPQPAASPAGACVAVPELDAPERDARASSTVTALRARGARRRAVTTPTLVGTPARDAVETLRRAGLTPAIEHHESDDADEHGIVVAQDPVAAADVARGSTVAVWVGAPLRDDDAVAVLAQPSISSSDEPPAGRRYDRARAYVDGPDDGWFDIPPAPVDTPTGFEAPRTLSPTPPTAPVAARTAAVPAAAQTAPPAPARARIARLEETADAVAPCVDDERAGSAFGSVDARPLEVDRQPPRWPRRRLVALLAGACVLLATLAFATSRTPSTPAPAAQPASAPTQPTAAATQPRSSTRAQHRAVERDRPSSRDGEARAHGDRRTDPTPRPRERHPAARQAPPSTTGSVGTAEAPAAAAPPTPAPSSPRPVPPSAPTAPTAPRDPAAREFSTP